MSMRRDAFEARHSPYQELEDLTDGFFKRVQRLEDRAVSSRKVAVEFERVWAALHLIAEKAEKEFDTLTGQVQQIHKAPATHPQALSNHSPEVGRGLLRHSDLDFSSTPTKEAGRESHHVRFCDSESSDAAEEKRQRREWDRQRAQVKEMERNMAGVQEELKAARERMTSLELEMETVQLQLQQVMVRTIAADHMDNFSGSVHDERNPPAPSQRESSGRDSGIGSPGSLAAAHTVVESPSSLASRVSRCESEIEILQHEMQSIMGFQAAQETKDRGAAVQLLEGAAAQPPDWEYSELRRDMSRQQQLLQGYLEVWTGESAGWEKQLLALWTDLGKLQDRLDLHLEQRLESDRNRAEEPPRPVSVDVEDSDFQIYTPARKSDAACSTELRMKQFASDSPTVNRAPQPWAEKPNI